MHYPQNLALHEVCGWGRGGGEIDWLIDWTLITQGQRFRHECQEKHSLWREKGSRSMHYPRTSPCRKSVVGVWWRGGERREVDALPSKPCPTGGHWLGGGGGGQLEKGNWSQHYITLRTLSCRKSVVGWGGGGMEKENQSKHYPQNLVLQEVSGGGGGWRRETDLSITLRTLSCRKSVAGWGGGVGEGKQI